MKQLLADSQAQLVGVVDPAATQMRAALAAVKIPVYPKLQLTALQWIPVEAAVTPMKSALPTVAVSANPTSAPIHHVPQSASVSAS